jgi:predicted  nucleic acid-binding Zn-ribbon protein
MAIKDILLAEQDALKKQIADLQLQVQTIENKISSIPAELSEIAEESVSKIRDWFKGL